MADKNLPLATISPAETEMLESLRQEMGLSTQDDVVRYLVRQAYHRTQVLCPSCGGNARKTPDGNAECNECMSILNLAEGTLVTFIQRRTQK